MRLSNSGCGTESLANLGLRPKMSKESRYCKFQVGSIEHVSNLDYRDFSGKITVKWIFLSRAKILLKSFFVVSGLITVAVKCGYMFYSSVHRRFIC